MKKFILTIALAASSLGGLATSAQAHGHEHFCYYGPGYCYPSFYGCYDDDDCGYWYWNNGCRFWHSPRHCR